MSKDLREFLEVAKSAGSDFYVEVKRPLKPKYEICVIQEKLAAEGRFPVIYCPEIEGSKLPLISNLGSSYEMLGLALGVTPEKIKTMGKSEIFQEYRRRLANGNQQPKEVPASEAPVKEVILRGDEVDLGLLPITHHHELDSGKYITIGVMICKDPDTGIPNAGIYRQEMKGKDKLGCYLAHTQNAAYIARRYAELGKPMEVVTFIGHHPAVIMGAETTGSLDMNELEVIGALSGEPLEVTRAETVDLPVPAYAEIAIEGIIDTTKMVTDGPFAEYTGYYGQVYPCYQIQVKAITMRRDAIYHDLDPAHREHNLWTLLGSESSLYDLVYRSVPTVKAVHYGGPRAIDLMYISIKKRTPGEGRLAGLAALLGSAESKFAVVVDEDIDVYNESEVLWAIGTRVRPDVDITIVPSLPTGNLDPTAHDETGIKRGPVNAKMVIDATKPVEQPFATSITPPKELWDSMKLEDYLK